MMLYRLSRRDVLRLVGLSAATTVCSACALNPFYAAEELPPEASELLSFRPAHASRAEVVSPTKGAERQVVVKQRYLKLVAGRRGSELVVGEKFSFAPREADGGISVAELSDKKLASLLRDPRVQEEATHNSVTVFGVPPDPIIGRAWDIETPFLSPTPQLLADGKCRVGCGPESTGARLTQPFELDVERNRWYAILLDVARSPDGGMPREHLCCLRVESAQEPKAGS